MIDIIAKTLKLELRYYHIKNMKRVKSLHMLNRNYVKGRAVHFMSINMKETLSSTATEMTGNCRSKLAKITKTRTFYNACLLMTLEYYINKNVFLSTLIAEESTMPSKKYDPRAMAKTPTRHHTWETVTRTSDEFKIPKRKCCLLYTSPSPRDRQKSRMPSSA